MEQKMNVRMINEKPVLYFGEKILGEIASFKITDAEPSTLAAASEQASEEPRYTLEEAFAYDGQGDYARDAVRGVLAVSFLLDSISKIGNKAVDARIAQGLAYALRDIAKDGDKFLTEKVRLKEAEHALQEARGRHAA